MDEAVAAARRAVADYAELAAAEPDDYAADHSYALQTLASVYLDSDDPVAAMESARAALDVCEQIPEAAVRVKRRVSALHGLATSSTALGRHSEAARYLQQITALRE